MARHIPGIRAIRSFVPFVIPYADFITNVTNALILTGYFLASPKEILKIDPGCTIRICEALGFVAPFAEMCEPYSIPKIVTSLKELGAKNIVAHIHYDFGMGVSSAILGYWHGANRSNLTFPGIGEQSGNTELEKILLFCVTSTPYHFMEYV